MDKYKHKPGSTPAALYFFSEIYISTQNNKNMKQFFINEQSAIIKIKI